MTTCFQVSFRIELCIICTVWKLFSVQYICCLNTYSIHCWCLNCFECLCCRPKYIENFLTEPKKRRIKQTVYIFFSLSLSPSLSVSLSFVCLFDFNCCKGELLCANQRISNHKSVRSIGSRTKKRTWIESSSVKWDPSP